MTEPSQRQKFAVNIGGDDTECFIPTDGQFVALSKAALVAQDANLPINSRLESLVLAQDIVLSLIASEQAWKDKLLTRLAMGEVTLAEITNAIMEVASTDGEPKPKVTPVKRGPGRPRKRV